MKVSVIIYALNSIAYIDKCIRSVMNQTLQEIEIIIVDGGSKDGTLEVIEKLMQSDNRICLIQTDAGVGHQFNIGLKKAKGEYIGICESDDYILPNMYEEQYKIAKKYHLDILRADSKQFFELNGKEYLFPNILSKDSSIYNRVIYLHEKKTILRMGTNGFWSGIYRRDFLLEQKIFMNETEGASYQDTSFAFLTIVKAERIMFSNRAFYCYRKDNPASSVHSPKKITSLLNEYQLLRKRLEVYGLFEVYKEIYWSWKIDGCLWFYYRVSKELKKEYIDIMSKNIYDDLSEGVYQGSELSKRAKQMLSCLKESIENLNNFMELYTTTADKLKIKLKNIPDDSEIIVFGCGEMGKLVSLYMKKNHKNLKIFIDNNHIKWGRFVENVLVENPIKAALEYPDACYIIANETQDKIMREQLIDLNISEKKIIICNNYTMFLDDILIKQLLEDKV